MSRILPRQVSCLPGKVLFWLIVGAVLLQTPEVPATNQNPATGFSETAVKAVFIYNLTRFISWPTLQGVFRIAVLGDPELTAAMRRTVAGERHSGRKIIVTDVYDPNTNQYQIIFVSRSYHTHKLISGNDLGCDASLSITDLDHAADQRFMVYLQNKEGRITLAMNPKLIKNSGIYVSPQILRMSRIIRSGDKE